MANPQLMQKVVVWSCALCLLSSCAWTPRGTRDNSSIAAIQDELATIDQADQSQSAAVLPPEQVDQALMPGLLPVAAERGEERFDISVSEVGARSFFMGLVKGTGINMVVHPDVEGSISLELQNVTVDEVMEIVNEVYGYPYRKRGNVIQVLPGGIRSEVFHIDYLSLKRRGMSETSVTNGEVSSAGSSSTNNSNNNSSSNNGADNNNRNQNRANVGTQIRTETEADFWKELQQTLGVLVGEGEGRAVIVTPQAGIVVVRGKPGEIDIVKAYLERAQLIMRRQVVLEAKILEVTLSEGYQTGIDWTAVTEVNTDNVLSVGSFGSPTTSPNNIGGFFDVSYVASDFTGVIDLLETQGSVQVLSSPRISTVNNQKAVIKVGQDEFFVTEISNTTTTTTGTTTNNPEVELTPFFSGIALDVTPQISEEEEIILHIHPSISEVEDQTKSIVLGSQLVELPLALSTIRETDSVVYARSGQVVVLGGLMQNKSTDINSGAPVFGNLPVVGHLFSQQRNQTVKSELVILLKPVIMGPDGLKNGTQRSRQRFEEFRRVLDRSYRSESKSEEEASAAAVPGEVRSDSSGNGFNRLY